MSFAGNNEGGIFLEQREDVMGHGVWRFSEAFGKYP